ncbi:tetratricopeptide repeat protein [Oscillospiraceae bacterium N12]|jgi:AraC-like DNA-binding protein|uniref:Tetratricopeptide repeat protein n=1 Tax=Jilunia laotingensis TaxID=2763675 RepID=A0A926INS1_9BACT|nr:tetratricopeptide repeat protein [Jilunia laotingensis]MBC8591991.1 tetratricopeptide repeat protein [Jilunia laotingensis]
MMNWKLFRFFLVLVCVASHLYAGDMLNYESLSGWPVSELIKHGDKYYEQNHLDTAIGYYIVLAGKYNAGMTKSDKYICTLACRSIANIYYQQENYAQAFEFYMKSLKISDENGFGELTVEAYKNLGNVYSVFTDNEQAIRCYEKGLKRAREYRDTINEVKFLINLSAICCYEKRTKDAWMYYNQMMKFVGNDKIVKYFSYFNKALIFNLQKQYNDAVSNYEKAVRYAERENLDPKYAGGVYGELAKLYRDMGKNDSALHYFHIYTDYSEKNKIMYMFVESLQTLAQLYAEIGDNRQSSYYKGRYMAVKDSLFNANEFNKMKNSQFVYEMDKNYQKIASLTEDSESKEQKIKIQFRILVGILAGMFVFVVLTIIVYLQKRKLNLAYKNLYYRNSELLQSEQRNREQRIESANKLIEERKRYALLEQKFNEISLNEGSSLQIKEEDQTREDRIVKLHSSDKLTDEQKEKILMAIIGVMENTQEFCDCDFGLERLAERVGSNSRYVSIVINETYNKNFRAFISEYRIKEAQIRLMDTNRYGNYTIKAIAESVGYKSPTNFISAFKNITGITPSVYQKIAKGK